MEASISVINRDPDEIISTIRAKGAAGSRPMIDALDPRSMDAFLAWARQASNARFGKVLKVYIPGRKFPAVSVTGASCDLHCKHCNDHYLHGMIPAETPEKLEQVLMGISKNGGTGALISGGSTRDGIVRLEQMHGVLGKVIHSTGMQLNVHSGLINEASARALRETGIATISLDLVGDDGTIRGIYGLEKTVDDYKNVLRGLMRAGFTSQHIIPHVCIGLDMGKVVGEHVVLDYLRELNPALVVFIVIIPPKHQAPHGFANVPAKDVARIIATTRVLYPDAEISLGCMRPGGRVRNEYDLVAFKAGITRIAVPTQAFLKAAREEGFTIDRMENCCALGAASSFDS